MEVKNEFLTIDEIKLLYPDEWVLIRLNEDERTSNEDFKGGEVLLHGKDRLELAYKASELPKSLLTRTFFTTPTKNHNRKWLSVTRLREIPKTN